MLSKAKIKTVVQKLRESYPSAGPELNYSNSFELLIATILSAQCTDVRVNIVTKELFKVLKEPADIYGMSLKELEDIIKTCGLYKAKASNIYKTCEMLIEEFDGEVPDNMEDLIKLHGVGRKVANVVLANAFDEPVIAVDTHVFRLANKIGLCNEKNVLQTEYALMKNIAKEDRFFMHHGLILHGRRVCTARSPKCDRCILNTECEDYQRALKSSAKKKKEDVSKKDSNKKDSNKKNGNKKNTSKKDLSK